MKKTLKTKTTLNSIYLPHPLKRILPEIFFDDLSPQQPQDNWYQTGNVIRRSNRKWNSTPHDIYHIRGIAHAQTNRKDDIFTQRRLVQNFTFILESGQGTCSLTKHTRRWAYSAKDSEIPLCHIPPLWSFFSLPFRNGNPDMSRFFICNEKIKILTRCPNQFCQSRLIFVNVKIKIRSNFKFRRVWILICQLKISNLVMSRFQLWTRPDFNFSTAKYQIRTRPDFNF